VDLCLRMAYEICSGLAYLHHEIRTLDGPKLAVAHRDFKPANIFLHRDLTCVIGDFGYAVVDKDSFSTQPNGVCVGNCSNSVEITDKVFVGTLRYMAPEVLRCTIDRCNFQQMKRSDVYSLGLVLWEIGYRTVVDGVFLNHTVPYSDITATEKDFKELRRVVCDEGRRPPTPTHWKKSEIMKIIENICKDCWAAPNNRVSAFYAQNRLGNIYDSRQGKTLYTEEKAQKSVMLAHSC